jgi:hypothetical protein
MELHHRPAFDASLNVKQLFRGVALAGRPRLVGAAVEAFWRGAALVRF